MQACHLHLCLLFFWKRKVDFAYLSLVTRGPGPWEVLIFYAVISCARLLSNWRLPSTVGSPSSAQQRPPGNRSHLPFEKVCVTLKKYTQNTNRRASFFSPSALPLPFWLYQKDVTHSSPGVSSLSAPASGRRSLLLGLSGLHCKETRELSTTLSQHITYVEGGLTETRTKPQDRGVTAKAMFYWSPCVKNRGLYSGT